jgi:hypothetical protein
MVSNNQLSFDDNLSTVNRKIKIDHIQKGCRLFGFGNQKFNLADKQLAILTPSLVKLGNGATNIVVNELYNINMFDEGLPELEIEKYSSDYQEIFRQEEFVQARLYVIRALGYYGSGFAEWDDACFYCHRSDQSKCDLPQETDIRFKRFLLRHYLPTVEARNNLVQRITSDPKEICFPRT